MCSPGKGYVGPECTTAQYVAYGETTVRPYLCKFYLSPVFATFNSTSSFTPKRTNIPGQDNTNSSKMMTEDTTTKTTEKQQHQTMNILYM